MYSYDEVMTYCQEEDVKFIRLAFCDLTGRQKNIAIMPEELGRAFRYGISFDASAIPGFGDEVRSDLFLFPDPSTLSVLPWRSAQGQWCGCSAISAGPTAPPLSGTAAAS